MKRELWGSLSGGSLNATADGLAREWARAQIVGRLASERDRGVLSHISADHTARDMLRITEAQGTVRTGRQVQQRTSNNRKINQLSKTIGRVVIKPRENV